MESVQLSEIAKNLNKISWEILNILERNEQGVTFSEFRKALGFSQEKLSKEIARLEGALLINAEKDPADQRSIIFTLSKYGREIKKYNL